MEDSGKYNDILPAPEKIPRKTGLTADRIQCIVKSIVRLFFQARPIDAEVVIYSLNRVVFRRKSS